MGINTAATNTTTHPHHQTQHQQLNSSNSLSIISAVSASANSAIIMDELAALVRTEIPEGRQSLRDSYTNLERVAEYCEDTYYRSDNKKLALEETKNYTTQSLASVAYQINTLAYNYLQLLDLQSQQLAEMESQMNHIAQTVSIHKEKVARREIGVLTANKVNSRQYKIVAPLNPEKPIKYVRKPIDYSVLDDVGHGITQQQQHMKGGLGAAKHRGSSGGSIQSSSAASAASMAARDVGPPPTTKPPTPPQSSRSQLGTGMGTMGKSAGNTGTLGKGSREYRTPPVVIPPQVPSHYAPNYPMGHVRRPTVNPPAAATAAGPSPTPASAERAAGYSTLPMPPSQQYAQHAAAAAAAASQTGGKPTVLEQQVSQNSTLPPPPPANIAYEEHHRMPPPPSPLTVLHEMPGHIGMHTLGRGATAGGHHHHHHQHHQQQHHQAGAGGSGGGRPGSQSPPLPPPPPPDEDGNQNFGRPRTSQGPMAAIVPDDHNLPGWVPKNYIEKVVAIYDYYADKDDELSFQESSVLYVLKKNDDGWWEGVMDGVTGLFPGNYVEPCV